MKDTVSSLRAQGLKVYVQHRRYFRMTLMTEFGEPVPVLNADPLTRSELQKFLEGAGNPSVTIETLARAGQTVVEIYNGEEKLGRGVATCSDKDGYCKKIGRAIALGRALENMSKTSSVSCNWSEMLEEIGTDTVRSFVKRELTARAFEGTHTNARKLVRQLGAEEVRRRARQALTRRNIAI